MGCLIMIEKVGKYCRNFRIDVLGMTIKQLADITETNTKNLWAFEHGKANSIKYLYLYYNVCNENEKDAFARGLFRCL